MTQPRLFCFGLGFTATTLARRLLAHGWQVAGTTRSEAKAEQLAAEGISILPFSREHPLAEPERALEGTTHLLSSVPPDAEGDPVLDAHGNDIARMRGTGWVGYLSTTGVYGDRDGDWVDEGSELRPSGSRGERRLAAERAWLDLGERQGLPVHLFRLAGIYGPGRNALETVRRGAAKRIDKPGQVFSRIHVEDIVTVLQASMHAPAAGRAYNVCDDLPAPPQDLIVFACELLGVPPPPLVPFEEAALSPMARSFYDDNKRVSNRRIKEELGVRLRYPDYREGLRALAAALKSRETPGASGSDASDPEARKAGGRHP